MLIRKSLLSGGDRGEHRLGHIELKSAVNNNHLFTATCIDPYRDGRLLFTDRTHCRCQSFNGDERAPIDLLVTAEHLRRGRDA